MALTGIFTRIRTVADGYGLVDVSPQDMLSLKGMETADPDRFGPLIRAAADTDVPLWLAFAGEAATLSDARVSVEGRPAEITDEEDAVVVVLPPSEVVRRLRRDHERFDQLLRRLRTAAETGADVLIAEDDQHDIQDVALPFGHAVPPLLRMKIDDEDRPEEALGGITMARARELVSMLTRLSCKGTKPPSDCIPFLYPDDGCWARAHQACRLFGDAGVASGKIWLYGDLRVRTPNNPRCRVGWWYHVAPRVEITSAGEHVIDPSMFDAPVPTATWISAQQDASAKQARTGAEVYFRPRDGTNLEFDRTYAKTTRKLATYRLKLIERILGSGPPPYAACSQ